VKRARTVRSGHWRSALLAYHDAVDDRSRRSGFTAAQATTLGWRTSLRPSKVGDVLEQGHGPILLLRIADLVETRPHSPLAALVKVAPAPMLVR